MKTTKKLTDIMPSKSELQKKPIEIDCNIELEINGKIWSAYTANFCIGDVLLYCDKGTSTFVIDWYGDEPSFELFDYEEDEE